MSHSIFGWDLPPGCSISDIPGNRPENEEWENIINSFFDPKRIRKLKYGIKPSAKEGRAISAIYRARKYDKVQSAVDTYIMMAIEYGIEIGEQKERDSQAENKGWDNLYHEEKRNPKLRAYFKKQRSTLRELYGVVEQFIRYSEQWQQANGKFPNGDGRILILKNARKAIEPRK